MLPILLGISLLAGQMGALSPFPGVYLYLHDIAIGCILIVWFWQRGKANQPYRTYGPLAWPIGAFVGACIISLVAHVHAIDQSAMARSLLYIARWAYYASVYYVVASDKNPIRWLKMLYWTGIGFALLGFLQLLVFPSLRSITFLGWDPHLYRLVSTLLDPNFTGIILVLTLALSMAMQSVLRKEVLWGSRVLLCVALLLTFSRSSVLALLAALGVWFLAKKQKIVLLVAALVVAAVIFIPKPGGDNLSIFRKDSTLARIVNWQQSGQLIASAPIFGHGFYALPLPGPMKPGTVSRANAVLDNSILFVFATTGLLGLIAYGWVLLKSEQLIESVKKVHSELCTAGLMSLSALIVHSFFVNSLFYAWTMIWLWVLLGSIQAVARRKSTR